MGDVGQTTVLPVLNDVFLYCQMLSLPPHPSQDQATGQSLPIGSYWSAFGYILVIESIFLNISSTKSLFGAFIQYVEHFGQYFEHFVNY